MLDVKLSGGLHRLGENLIFFTFYLSISLTNIKKTKIKQLFSYILIRIPSFDDNHSSYVMRYSNVAPGLCDSASFPMSQLSWGSQHSMVNVLCFVTS